MSEIELKSSYGNYIVKRLPHRKNEKLRAWDAADLEILNHLYQNKANSNKNLLVINDTFGALSTVLNSFSPINWSDSWVTHEALRQNFKLNNLSADSYSTLDSLHIPKTKIDIVLLKIPKSLAMLEFQLIKLREVVDHDTHIIVSGMVKYMPKKVWHLLEIIIGTTETCLAVKKSKMILVNYDEKLDVSANTYPTSWTLENTQFEISNNANVFSQGHLDVGTRFLIDHMPVVADDSKVIDLACGSGILGLLVAESNPSCDVLFIDESYMAIDSAKTNLKQLSNQDRFSFHCGDGLHKIKKQSADIILCNPPFHQHHSTGETVALTMFSHAARVLNKTGELWIVANRHLSYHVKLPTWFYEVTLIASNKSFVVLKASKPK